MKQRHIAYFIFLLIQCCAYSLQAQMKQDSLTFEELYDEPYKINKLFVGFQPFYGEVFATNVNAGFGLEAQYYYKNKFNIKFNYRQTYGSKFYDLNREVALRNSVVSNEPVSFNYFELGGTYHIKDFDVASTTSIYLYKKKFSANRWASTVPLHAEVPAKLRKIIGVRAGVIYWKSTADLSRALDKQGLSNADLVTAENVPLPDTYIDSEGEPQNLNAYSNLFATNIYVGGSITRIRNMAVSFNNYDEGMDDGIFTLFMDIIFAPSLTLDPVVYQGSEYSVDAIKLNNLGMRVGMEGKFNRKLGWGYGGELGYRPSIDGRGFFALLKIAFPVFSTNLEHKVEAYGN